MREALDERFSRQLGPGFETSSAYIEAKNDLEGEITIQEDLARRGDIQLGTQLSLLVDENQRQGTAQNLSTLTNAGNFQLPLAGAVTGTSGAITSSLGQLFAGRQGAFQANLFNAQQANSLRDAGLGLVSQAGGTLAGIFGAKQLGIV